MGAISSNFDSMKTNSTMLGMVNCVKIMMVVGVLNCAVLQSTPPNEDSTIPGTLVVKGQVLTLLVTSGKRSTCICLLTCVDLPFFRFMLLVFAMMFLPACSRQHYVSDKDSKIFLSAMMARCSLCRSKRCGPSIQPLRPTIYFSFWIRLGK